MDRHRFDALTRSLGAAATRRGLGRAVAGGGFAVVVGLAFAAPDIDAKKKRRKKKKSKKQQPPQPVLNHYGCLDVGQPCQGDSTLCCSGICEGIAPKKGKPDTSRCAGHNAGICQASFTMCRTGNDAICSVGHSNCHCTLTTGNAAFCADFSEGALSHCRVCRTDVDCQAEFGPGTACVIFDAVCANYCPATGGTACMPACAI